MIIRILFVLLTSAAAQAQVFDLDKPDDKAFKKFVTQKKIIVVGEMHGTAQVPEFVFRLVKMMVEEKKQVTVGLEIEKNLQGNVDEYVKQGDFNKLLTLDYFKYPDGRSSVAMGELMKQLRTIRGVRIICFDVESKATGDRDSLMAVNLSGALSKEPMIILTGNLHANLKEGYWRRNFKSAIHRFAATENLGDQLISLNTYFGGGTIWNCMKDGCKERQVNSNAELQKRYGLNDFVVVDDKFLENGYSGFVYFNTVAASEPLVK